MIKWLTYSVFLAAWALWFGGAVTILILVSKLFQYDRGLAIQVAPEMFLTFERYQLGLALVTVAAAIIAMRRSTALLLVIPAAAVIVAVSALVVTPRIDHLRLIGETGTSAFRSLHGLSMVLYLVEVILLLLAGLIIAWNSQRKTICQPANATLFDKEPHEISK